MCQLLYYSEMHNHATNWFPNKKLSFLLNKSKFLGKSSMDLLLVLSAKTDFYVDLSKTICFLNVLVLNNNDLFTFA